jgi:hypothetical protein
MNPIDRTNYNKLVDDDGTGTVGTVWDKGQVKTVILDPVDAALATVGKWIDVPYAAGNFGSDQGAVWFMGSGSMPVNHYVLDNKRLSWNFVSVGFTLGNSLAKELRLVLPAGLVSSKIYDAMTVPVCLDGAGVQQCSAYASGSYWLSITKQNNSAFTGATITLHFSIAGLQVN